MSLTPNALKAALIDRASQRFRPAGHFAYHFSRGKLGGDPVFLALLERGLLRDRARILDLGCGQGLLAAWLLAAREQYLTGAWPEGWPEPASPGDIRGVDLLASDIRRASAALPAPARFEQGDMRFVDFAQADAVVILDALHYVDIAAQNDVLRRVRAALPPGGLFLTRVGNAAAGVGFQLSNWVDRSVAFFRGNRLPPLHCRPLPDWIAALEALGFSVETAAMNGRLPFANVMLIAYLGEKPARLNSNPARDMASPS
jgi:SAM-dependent methyltransferase